jgi:hypothetical protein
MTLSAHAPAPDVGSDQSESKRQAEGHSHAPARSPSFVSLQNEQPPEATKRLELDAIGDVPAIPCGDPAAEP